MRVSQFVVFDEFVRQLRDRTDLAGRPRSHVNV